MVFAVFHAMVGTHYARIISRFTKQSPRRDLDRKPTVSVIIPAHNEESYPHQVGKPHQLVIRRVDGDHHRWTTVLIAQMP